MSAAKPVLRPANQDLALLRSYTGPGVMPMPTNPLAKALSCQVRAVDRAAGRIELGFEAPAWLSGPDGTPLQVARMAMLDFALGFVGMPLLQEGQSVSTLTLDTHPVEDPVGGGLWIATAWVQAHHGDILYVAGELSRQGQVAMAARSSLLVLTLPA